MKPALIKLQDSIHEAIEENIYKVLKADPELQEGDVLNDEIYEACIEDLGIEDVRLEELKSLVRELINSAYIQRCITDTMNGMADQALIDRAKHHYYGVSEKNIVGV